MIIMESSKALIRDFVRAINARNWDRLDELVAPGFVRHSHAAGEPGVRSREELKAFLRREFETFPDAVEQVEDLIAESNKVAARHSFRGTQRGPLGDHPPTGKVLASTYLAIYRIEEGRIAEAWAEWDNLHGLAQLGHYGQRS